MATISSNGTGGGNWSAGSSWTGGVAPVAGTDNATILSGDTITKDTAANASKDALVCTVNSGGTLAIGSNGIKVTNFAGTGLITGGDNGTMETTSYNATNPTFQIQASSGNEFQYTCAGILITGSNARSSPQIWQWVDIHFNNTSYLLGSSFNEEDLIENCWFDDPQYECFFVFTGCTRVVFRNCFFSGAGRDGVDVSYSDTYFYNCVFGKERDGTTATNSTCDLNVNSGFDAFCYGCEFNSSTEFSVTSQSSNIYSQSHQAARGDWRTAAMAGEVFRSTASKNGGTYGVEMVPTSNCSTEHSLYVDIPIPIESGDTVAPSIYYKNAGGDLALENTTGLLTFELDPGDEWGLNETQDANSYADATSSFVQISFTGGTAAGSTDVGTVILRIKLSKYVSTGVVYIADPDWGVS